jgi:DNA-binding transcriptional regulator YdaS (Cro superfamily)
MRTEDAVKHFGSKAALADALGIRQPSVQEWGEYPPEERQLDIQRITDGKLRAERAVLRRFKDLLQGIDL